MARIGIGKVLALVEIAFVTMSLSVVMFFAIEWAHLSHFPHSSTFDSFSTWKFHSGFRRILSGRKSVPDIACEDTARNNKRQEISWKNERDFHLAMDFGADAARAFADELICNHNNNENYAQHRTVKIFMGAKWKRWQSPRWWKQQEIMRIILHYSLVFCFFPPIRQIIHIDTNNVNSTSTGSHVHSGRSKLIIMEHLCVFFFALLLLISHFACRHSTRCVLRTTHCGCAAKTIRQSEKANRSNGKRIEKKNSSEMNIYFNLWLCCSHFREEDKECT